jgi:cellulose synthase (UDP-forming)
MTSPHPEHETLEAPRRLLVLVFVGVGLWYLHWRLGTFNPAAPVLSRLVYAAEVFGFVTALLHFFMCWRMTVRRAAPPRVARSVDVFVPTYNESVAMVRQTLLAALAMEHRHTVWLLDDGRRDEMRRLARELGCSYLARPDNRHAKAGNLNHALQHSAAELVAVFDCDHAPRRDFLTQTLGYFDDERVAFVQTPQDFYNLDSFQHRGDAREGSVWTEQSLFFRVIQRGKDRWNAAFFCGSCAVVRRSALDAIGGFATGTVTEDLHTSIRLHARGWKSVYHAHALAFGLAPESIEPFIGQRVRWGQGAMHVWRKEGLLTHKGLSWAQRLNYFASVLTYFDGWQKLVMYGAPVVVLLTGTMPLLTDTPSFLLHFVPYYLLTFWAFEEVGRGYGRTLLIEQYNMARFAAFAWSTLAWILPRKAFRVTAKGAHAGSDLRFTLPHWLVLGFNAVAIPVGVGLTLAFGRLPVEGLVANSIWAAVNGSLAAAVLVFTARRRRNARTGYRFPVPVGAELVMADGARIQGTVDDLSEHGLRFYGQLPPGLAPGAPLTGWLRLPDGPLAFWGEARSVGAHAADPEGRAGPRSVGCSLTVTGPGRVRLEQFLFGSDLQWHLNGLSDRVHTPLSRWLPRWVDGPRPHPLSARHWMTVELRPAVHLPPMQALMCAPEAGDTRPVYAVSHGALPTGVPLVLDQFRRARCERLGVQLQPADLPGVGFFVYQALPAAMPAPLPAPPAPASASATPGAPATPVAPATGVAAPQGGPPDTPIAAPARADAPDTHPAALEAEALIRRARRSRGEPSTFDVDPSTL